LIELPFPGKAAEVDGLLDNFLSSVRIPGSARYVLDLSGSMAGQRITSLKEAMQMLASDRTTDRYARFQNREEVGIITFSSETAPTRLFPMGSTPEENAKARAEVSGFIAALEAGGGTAIYTSVKQALMELDQERAANKEKRYYTVVLMTDGENNRGLTPDQFKQWYKEQGASLRGIRVFPILFGEASPKDLQELADVTGGRAFDSRSKALAAVFKEIRGYQ
jgi:Ca-activated chloride channel family protein